MLVFWIHLLQILFIMYMYYVCTCFIYLHKHQWTIQSFSLLLIFWFLHINICRSSLSGGKSCVVGPRKTILYSICFSVCLFLVPFHLFATPNIINILKRVTLCTWATHFQVHTRLCHTRLSDTHTFKFACRILLQILLPQRFMKLPILYILPCPWFRSPSCPLFLVGHRHLRQWAHSHNLSFVF